MARHHSLVLGACLCLFVFTACSEGDATPRESETPSTPGAATPTSGPEAHDSEAAPSLALPASRYTILQSDLTGEFLTDIAGTFVLTVDKYKDAKVFSDPEEGYQYLSEWGYAGGYETGYIPEGRERAVLNGAYYFAVETHLFGDEDGARTALEYMAKRLDESVSETVSSDRTVGNESESWVAPGGRIPGSSVESVHHRVAFRRGNIVVMVATWGADSFMRVDTAYMLALIVDEKALGERDAPEPTPTGQQPAEEETAVVGS